MALVILARIIFLVSWVSMEIFYLIVSNIILTNLAYEIKPNEKEKFLMLHRNNFSF